MGIFTRMRDILNSNINAILDRAEDPAKMLRLMLQEMEDTLIEIKAQCASAMAQGKTLERQVDDIRNRSVEWGAKARMAVEKGRDALAKEALMEKHRLQDRVEPMEEQLAQTDELIEKYRSDITELEAKIRSVRDRQKLLLQRQTHAETKKRSEERMRKVNGVDVFGKFETFERRVDRIEAEADLVNYGTKPTLTEQFEELENDDRLEQELAALKDSIKDDKKEEE